MIKYDKMDKKKNKEIWRIWIKKMEKILKNKEINNSKIYNIVGVR